MLRKCLAAAMTQLHSHAEHTGIDIADVDESTFRFFVLAEIKRRYPRTKCQREWKRIDLLVTTSTGQHVAIEFKFYVLRKAYPLDSDGNSKPHWKGSASKQNKGEFDKCIKKLRDLKEIHEKYLVLVYDRKQHDGKTSFEESYCDLKKRFGTAANSVKNCWGRDVACWLIQVG